MKKMKNQTRFVARQNIWGNTRLTEGIRTVVPGYSGGFPDAVERLLTARGFTHAQVVTSAGSPGAWHKVESPELATSIMRAKDYFRFEIFAKTESLPL